jgi:hypothetical protein
MHTRLAPLALLLGLAAGCNDVTAPDPPGDPGLQPAMASAEAARTVRIEGSNSATGALVGSCGDFDVLTDWTTVMKGTVRFDKAGQLAQVVVWNSVIGSAVYYNSMDPTKQVLGIPGEKEIIRETFVDGQASKLYIGGTSWSITIPHYGPIFFNTGLIVIDLNTGELLHSSGPKAGEEDLAALCAYLQ